MEIRNWLVLTALLVLLPVWMGSIWGYFVRPRGRWNAVLFCWMAGFLTNMAIAELILVPLVLRRYHFAMFCRIFYIVCGLLHLIALVLLWKWIKEARGTQREVRETEAEHSRWWILFLCGALLLILLQAFGAGLFQHIDDDDARFVTEQVIAVEQGTMYKEHLVTGDRTYWDLGEMRKDMISPWTMFLALYAKVSGIAPAILCHKYLPVFLILLCYAVYTLIGARLFRQDKEKLSIFLIFVSALNIYGYYSTHTTQAVLLLRIWQGKALVASLLIPAMIYLMWSIMEEHRAAWYFLAAVGAAAGALASGTGITVLPVLVGAFGLAELVHTRSWKRMLLMWATALPSLVYLLCYVRFWDIVQVYY